MILVMDDNDHFPMLGETVYVAMQLHLLASRWWPIGMLMKWVGIH
jgi:hypothetical protein